MHLIGQIHGLYRLRRHPPIKLTENAKYRLGQLKAWLALQAQGLTSQQASSALDMPRATLYRWNKKVREKGLKGLEEGRRRPKHLRCPRWDIKLVETIIELRQLYPRWGKNKLNVMLRREGLNTSISTIGRILKYLKGRHLLPEPSQKHISWSKRRPLRPHAVRKPRDYEVKLPGDLVQIDVLDIRPFPGWACKHFTARDVISRWDVVQTFQHASSLSTTQFLDRVIQRAPFPIQAIQVDGGSEFKALFEKACQEKGIKLFILPPRSPKLNGCVERAHRTHLEEFYQIYNYGLDLNSLNVTLSEWERIYNHVRPHQSLDNLTPAEYIQRHHPQFAPRRSHMY
jgi:transposase InsO family protein